MFIYIPPCEYDIIIKCRPSCFSFCVFLLLFCSILEFSVFVFFNLSCIFRYQVLDWVKFRKNILNPTYGWQGANHKSVGFVQSVQDKDNLLVSFCSGEARVMAKEVIKVIALDRGQHVKLRADVEEPRSVSTPFLLILHQICRRNNCNIFRKYF